MRVKGLLLSFLLLGLPQPTTASVDFDGADDNISKTSITWGTNVSLAVWAYPRTVGEGGAGRICRLEVGNGNNFQVLGTAGTERVAFSRSWSTAAGVWVTPNGSLTLNAWNHIVVTYNGSATTNDPLIYINGVSQSITELAAPSGTLNTSSATLWFGNQDASTRTWDGLLDEFYIWDAVLSSVEVDQLARSRVKRFGLQIQPTAINLYWPLDDLPDGITGDDQTFMDLGPNRRNGTGADGAETGLLVKAEAVCSYP